MAGELFGYMKRKRMNVEYVQEVAKDLVWLESKSIDDQLYILGKQHHRLYMLQGKVDYIITDSPIILGIQYSRMAMSKFVEDPKLQDWFKSFDALVLNSFNLYSNVNLLINRGQRKYMKVGRYQTEEEAVQIDKDIRHLLTKNNLPFFYVKELQDVLNILGV
jgi:hypothetical protein